MKKINLLPLFLLLMIVLVGCASHISDESSTPNNSTDVSDKNPFHDEDEMSSSVLGNIGHGATKFKMDENGKKKQPFNYCGGEMDIAYEVHASGRAKNVGFLLFLDGVAQPYKVGSSANYEIMHVFDLKEDNKKNPFSFLFQPITGKKGETLSLSVVSVYAPDFIPDMKKTSSYGGYHGTLECNYEIYFEEGAELPDSAALPKYRKLQNVKQSTEPITQEHLDSLSDLGGTVTLETLNKQVMAEQYFNGQGGLLDNLKINEDGTIHVTFKILGYPGARYRNTIYVNHQALSDGKNTSFETVLTKGNISVIEADIDLSELEDFNTFYVVSSLCNVQELWEDGTFLLKTPSVLLYKKR